MASPLARKLLIREGSRLLLLDPPAGAEATLDALRPHTTEAEPGAPKQVALVFVRTADGVARHADMVSSVLGNGAVAWLAYPKLSSKEAGTISRDRGWDALTARGLRPVTQGALDDTWSALRFRRVEDAARR